MSCFKGVQLEHLTLTGRQRPAMTQRLPEERGVERIKHMDTRHLWSQAGLRKCLDEHEHDGRHVHEVLERSEVLCPGELGMVTVVATSREAGTSSATTAYATVHSRPFHGTLLVDLLCLVAGYLCVHKVKIN